MSAPEDFNGEVPEWLKGADCKSAVYDFDGSNPSLPTNKGLQETADPFVLPGKARVYWPDADLPAKKTNHQNSV